MDHTNGVGQTSNECSGTKGSSRQHVLLAQVNGYQMTCVTVCVFVVWFIAASSSCGAHSVLFFSSTLGDPLVSERSMLE